MPTSMLEALAHEQNEILKLGIEASRLGIEAVRRANLLRQQIEALAAEARDAPPSIAADASEEQFLQFQAEHFPDVMLGEQEEIRDTPGDTPAAQDGGAGKQGSAASVPGGAATREITEVEQAVADVASGEQEASAPLRDDPKAAPDAPNSLSNQALDLHASTDLRPGEIAEKIGSTKQAVGKFLRQGRLSCDPRAAAGDLRRQEVAPENKAPAAQQGAVGSTALPDLSAAALKRTGVPLAELDLAKCEISLDGQAIIVARHELRIVHLLNDQVPTPADRIMGHIQAVTRGRLRQYIEALNPRLNQIGLDVHEVMSGMYQLRRLQVA